MPYSKKNKKLHNLISLQCSSPKGDCGHRIPCPKCKSIGYVDGKKIELTGLKKCGHSGIQEIIKINQVVSFMDKKQDEIYIVFDINGKRLDIDSHQYPFCLEKVDRHV